MSPAGISLSSGFLALFSESQPSPPDRRPPTLLSWGQSYRSTLAPLSPSPPSLPPTKMSFSSCALDPSRCRHDMPLAFKDCSPLPTVPSLATYSFMQFSYILTKPSSKLSPLLVLVKRQLHSLPSILTYFLSSAKIIFLKDFRLLYCRSLNIHSTSFCYYAHEVR